MVYDGLAVMYGAAHGFGGGDTHHLVIRNCDLGYIGGAHQFTRPDGKPVRFGNAIEFWGAAHDNLVEGCRIWEVYDAALTNQGRGPDSKQINITYRNNLIRNSEYSFEYWNNPETAVTKNIRFVNNTCVNAGSGWAHAQRPDPQRQPPDVLQQHGRHVGHRGEVQHLLRRTATGAAAIPAAGRCCPTWTTTCGSARPA